MQGAFVATWRAPRQGLGKQAIELGVEVNDWWGKQAAAGKCTAPEMFFSSARGLSIWMVKGDLDVLHELERKVDVQRLLLKSALVFEEFSYDLMFTGEAADEYIGRYATAAGELGLM